MAKLSAHGQELARMEKADTLSSGTSVVSTKVLMADGVVLAKSTFLKTDGKVDFSDGWKRSGRSKYDAPVWVTMYQQLGWRRA